MGLREAISLLVLPATFTLPCSVVFMEWNAFFLTSASPFSALRKFFYFILDPYTGLVLFSLMPWNEFRNMIYPLIASVPPFFPPYPFLLFFSFPKPEFLFWNL